jgi:hypothetical protein
MSRRPHPNKEIEASLKYAEENGWRVEIRNGHAWGRIHCPLNDDQCRCGRFCITSVWSTPKDAFTHARFLKRVVDNCVHQATQETDSAKEQQ